MTTSIHKHHKLVQAEVQGNAFLSTRYKALLEDQRFRGIIEQHLAKINASMHNNSNH
jgi:hypothetical protein